MLQLAEFTGWGRADIYAIRLTELPDWLREMGEINRARQPAAQ